MTLEEKKKKYAKLGEEIKKAELEEQKKSALKLAKAFEKLTGAKNITTVEELSAVLDDYYHKKNGY